MVSGPVGRTAGSVYAAVQVCGWGGVSFPPGRSPAEGEQLRPVAVSPLFVLSPSPVLELLQSNVSRYPFQTLPPAYVRAHRYKYWFTEPKDDGSVSLALFPYFHSTAIEMFFYSHFFMYFLNFVSIKC